MVASAALSKYVLEHHCSHTEAFRALNAETLGSRCNGSEGTSSAKFEVGETMPSIAATPARSNTDTVEYVAYPTPGLRETPVEHLRRLGAAQFENDLVLTYVDVSDEDGPAVGVTLDGAKDTEPFFAWLDKTHTGVLVHVRRIMPDPEFAQVEAPEQAPVAGSPTRFEVPLSGGLETGLRNDPEAPMVAAVRTGSNGTAIVELEIDPATSGFENVVWLTSAEAVEYALAILRAAGAAAAQNVGAR